MAHEIASKISSNPQVYHMQLINLECPQRNGRSFEHSRNVLSLLQMIKEVSSLGSPLSCQSGILDAVFGGKASETTVFVLPALEPKNILIAFPISSNLCQNGITAQRLANSFLPPGRPCDCFPIWTRRRKCILNQESQGPRNIFQNFVQACRSAEFLVQNSQRYPQPLEGWIDLTWNIQ